MENSAQKTHRSSRLRRGIAVAILLLSTAIFMFFTAEGHTPAFENADGQSIAEERMMSLGGVDQYLLIRGRDRQAPLLIFVHGGPGASTTPFWRTYNSELEDEFVMVYWDQRGAVKSYNSEIDPASMTIDQLTSDLDKLIDALLVEFTQEQVLLVGHSFGTIIALDYVAAHPENVAAYVAVSQITDHMQSDLEGYEWALAQAKATGNESAISQLEEIGKPPYEIEEFYTQRRLVNQLGGGLVEYRSDFELLRTALRTPEYTLKDAYAFVQGANFSSQALWPEQQNYNAFSRHQKIEVPVYMIFGRHDRVISTQLGAEFFDQLESPSKELIWFENSAHSPMFEEPKEFNTAIFGAGLETGLIKITKS